MLWKVIQGQCITLPSGLLGMLPGWQPQCMQDKDIKRLYPELSRDMKVTLVEANEILASFDVSLREYTAQHLQRSGVKLVKVCASILVLSGQTDELHAQVPACVGGSMLPMLLLAITQVFHFF